jgi:hypothetical protein
MTDETPRVNRSFFQYGHPSAFARDRLPAIEKIHLLPGQCWVRHVAVAWALANT